MAACQHSSHGMPAAPDAAWHCKVAGQTWLHAAVPFTCKCAIHGLACVARVCSHWRLHVTKRVCVPAGDLPDCPAAAALGTAATGAAQAAEAVGGPAAAACTAHGGKVLTDSVASAALASKQPMMHRLRGGSCNGQHSAVKQAAKAAAGPAAASTHNTGSAALFAAQPQLLSRRR